MNAEQARVYDAAKQTRGIVGGGCTTPISGCRYPYAESVRVSRARPDLRAAAGRSRRAALFEVSLLIWRNDRQFVPV
jgi:hypothetical protein